MEVGCPMPYHPRTTHKPQPGEVDHPSGLPYLHPSHQPPHAKTLSTCHTEKSVERKHRKKLEREGGDAKTHEKQNPRNARRHKQATHMEMRAHTTASTHWPPGRKRADQHPGTTNKASPEGTSTGTLQGKPGNATGNTGNANNVTLLPRHAGKRREC